MYNKTLAKLKNKSFLKQHAKLRVAIPYEKASKIGIVVDKLESHEYAKINQIIENIEKEGKSVEVAYFRKKENTPLKDSYIPFNKKDFSINGSLKNTQLKRFVDTPFDFLFSISKSLSFPLKIILSQSKAKCRIGKYHEKKEKYFEMMVQQNSNQDFSELVKQMNIFAKKVRA